MDDLSRLLIERACERLATQYTHFVDHGEAAKMADLFTEDGVCNLHSGPMNGRAAILANFQKRQSMTGRRSRHVCCNMLVNVLDEDHAEGVVYLTLYRHDGDPAKRTAPSGPPNRIGEYRDTYVRTPDGWRIKTRVSDATFAAEE